jgi:hypothetical protein
MKRWQYGMALQLITSESLTPLCPNPAGVARESYSDRPPRPGTTCLLPRVIASSSARRRRSRDVVGGQVDVTTEPQPLGRAWPTPTQPSRHVRRPLAGRPDADRLTVPAAVHDGRPAGGRRHGRTDGRTHPSRNEPGHRIPVEKLGRMTHDQRWLRAIMGGPPPNLGRVWYEALLVARYGEPVWKKLLKFGGRLMRRFSSSSDGQSAWLLPSYRLPGRVCADYPTPLVRLDS